MIRGLLIGALGALLLCAASLLDPTLLGSEWLLHDAFARKLAESRKPDTRIVIVGVSDETVRVMNEFYGRPPYPRSVYALVVEELKRAGARLIVFDILFSEEDVLRKDDDRAFGAAIRDAPVVLAAQTGGRVILPHPEFRGAKAIGTIRLATSDRSSTIHHSVLYDGPMPSLAVATARLLGVAPAPPPATLSTMLIRWTAPRPEYHLNDLLAVALANDEPGAIPPEQIAKVRASYKDKIVIIGYTASGLYDLRATPLAAAVPGIHIHANALDNILNRDFARRAPRAVVLPLVVLLGCAFGAALQPIRSQVLSAIFAIAVVALVLAGGYAAMASGIVLPNVAAAATIALTYVTITVTKLFAEQEQTAMLRTTFGRYVSPQILQHVLAHPESVQLGGERREMTILFSDIRGFTSISEAAEPEEVVEMLNEYLTRMVEILLAHGGTLDKFIGDAVMGFWNAPARDPDHARHAVECAVEMIEETARIRAKWETEGKAAIRIGIGVNTGEAVVGNIGAEKVFGYTVIGDAVNLASRLEGKNKDYGTEIIVSEFTLRRIGDAFETVYLDDVKVKGKEKAVKIYEVKGTR